MTDLSSDFANAVQRASAWTVRVQARRGPPASGIALAPDLILTADHVVDPGREDAIRVGLPDGAELTAALVGRDPTTDIALLRLPESRLTPAEGASAEPRVGSLALAVARPGPDPQASLGLVTGLGG